MTPLRLVVNGEEIDLDVGDAMPLGAVVQHALRATRNTGRPAEDWDVRTESGALLSPDLQASALPPGSVSITLKLGCGG